MLYNACTNMGVCGVMVLFYQLAPDNDRDNLKFADLRWSQTGTYGFCPNALLQNVFMAVALDLPDFDSPYGRYCYVISDVIVMLT